MSIVRTLIRRILGPKSRYNEDDCPSVVLLLRDPEFPEPETVVHIAEEAWGTGGPVKLIGTLRKKQTYTFSCHTSSGPLWFAIHTQARSYGSEGQEPLEIMQRPWDEHRAWMAIDSPHTTAVKLIEKNALAEIYKCLLIYAFKVWSPNVLAVFFPSERLTIPNFGDLAGSIKCARHAGADMRFLG